MKKIHLILVLILFLLLSCRQKNGIRVEIKNTLNKNVSDRLIRVNLADIPAADAHKLAVLDGQNQLPSQLVDRDGDGKMEQLAFLVDLTANQTKQIAIREINGKKFFRQRAHAEISEKRDYTLVDGVYKGGHFVSVKQTKTPPEHKDHNLFYKCEGPCWESDKVGYRIYLDWRNSIDIFGKKVSDMVLPVVGHRKDQSGNDTYHTMSSWGMDIFKVGNSLGLGTFAAYADGKVEKVSRTDSVLCTITNDGPIFAGINTKYYGWQFNNQKIDLQTTLSIAAGSRLTSYNLDINGNYHSFCTGVAKHPDTELFKELNEDSWGYIALWGKQSLAGDNLGIAVFFHSKYKPELTEDDLSYIVLLHPLQNNIQYYFSACWEQEPQGIQTKEQFVGYLRDTVERLNHPVEVHIEQ